jgi:hypothetical protein
VYSSLSDVTYSDTRRPSGRQGREPCSAGTFIGLHLVYPIVRGHNYAQVCPPGSRGVRSQTRYCAAAAHTHPPFCTIKVDLYSDAQCKTTQPDVIPYSIGDKYQEAIGGGCAGADYYG